MTPPSLDDLLTAAINADASDLLLQEGEIPALRMDYGWTRLETTPASPALLESLAQRCGFDPARTDVDGILSTPDGHRFRVNWHRQGGHPAAVLRRVRREIPSFSELGLPGAILQDWAARPQGLILFCGPTGSGKSTSVAATLQWINQNQPRHLISVEDPVEFLFTPQLSVITQREVGLDVPSFAEGLRRALRQSPDVIFVGEIRDLETARTALQAAETGHLVLSTLHVSSAVESLQRLSLLFPESERGLLRAILARELVGVLGQRLVPGLSEGRPVLIAEYFTNEGMVGQCLSNGDASALADWLERSEGRAARSLTRSFLEELAAGRISQETALAHAPEPAAILRSLRGLR